MIAPIWSDNVKMLRMARKMGFVEEGRLTGAQPNGDICLFTLTAENSRVLVNMQYGQKGSSSSIA